jgi:hypothetical protein
VTWRRGYTNLINHLKNCVGPDYLAAMEEYVVINQLAVDANRNVDVKQ